MTVLFAKLGPAVPEAFIEDRKKLMGDGDFRAMMAAGPLFQDQLRAHAQLLDAQLADGRAFLLGDTFSWADAAAYHPIWFLLGMPPTAGAFDEFERIGPWAARLRGIGHGRRSEMTPEEAVEIAKASEPATERCADARARCRRRGGPLPARGIPSDQGLSARREGNEIGLVSGSRGPKSGVFL